MIKIKSNVTTETPDSVLKLLDKLLERSAESLLNQIEEKPKLGDFIKMLETRMNLAPDDASRKELWKLLEKVRREQLVLPKKKEKKKQRTTVKRKKSA